MKVVLSLTDKNYKAKPLRRVYIEKKWKKDKRPLGISILKQFLKAEFVFKDKLFAIDEGTPQGGVISQILANMALDGIQKLLVEKFYTNSKGKVDGKLHNKHKVNLVRYADDFIVTARTEEIELKAKEVIKDFLKTRGLELSEEYTNFYGDGQNVVITIKANVGFQLTIGT